MRFFFSILRDTAAFWVCNLPCFLLLTLFFVTPVEWLFATSLYGHHRPTTFAYPEILGLVKEVTRSAVEAAILGLMLCRDGSPSVVEAMRKGISAGFWKLLLINLVIAALTLILIQPVLTGLIDAAHQRKSLDEHGWIKMTSYLMGATFVLTATAFAKFGLTFPVIVAEKLPLAAAFRESWLLSGNDVAGVILCGYLIVHALYNFISHHLGLAPQHGSMPSPFYVTICQTALSLVSYLYLILLGLLYKRLTLLYAFLKFKDS